MKTLECSHATGAHDEPCDLVAGLTREVDGLRAQSDARLKALLQKAEEARREWIRAENAEGRSRAYIVALENDNAALALAVKELARCLGHERCSVCGQLYKIDPKAMGCCLADHVESYAAIIGKVDKGG